MRLPTAWRRRRVRLVRARERPKQLGLRHRAGPNLAVGRVGILALLVSTDDSASEILGRVLPAMGIVVERFSDLATAIDRLQQQRFDALVVDFEDPRAAASVLEEAHRLNSGNSPVTVALVAERAKARDILSGGA